MNGNKMRMLLMIEYVVCRDTVSYVIIDTCKAGECVCTRCTATSKLNRRSFAHQQNKVIPHIVHELFE